MLHVQPQNILQLDFDLQRGTPGDNLAVHHAFRRLARSGGSTASKAFNATYRLNVERKAVLLSSDFTNTDTRPGLFGLTSQRPGVYQLMRNENIDYASVSNWKETTGTGYSDWADVGAENSAVPELGTFTASAGTVPVRKIWALARASSELLEDFTAFSNWINERIAKATLQRLDWEIINGDGTGAHLTGILSSSPSTVARGANKRTDTLLTAVQRVRSVGFGEPSAIVAHPDDILTLQQEKDSNNAYLAGAPADYASGEAPLRFAGVPVLQSTATPAGTLIAADWSGAVLYMRRQFSIDTSATDGTDWRNDRLAIKGSLRAALVVHEPAKFVAITGF